MGTRLGTSGDQPEVFRFEDFYPARPSVLVIEAAMPERRRTAVCSYLLVAIARQRLSLDLTLCTVLQILSVSLFEIMPMTLAFPSPDLKIAEVVSHNQLSLLDS